MSEGQLQHIATRLEASGYDAGELLELQGELDNLLTPPSMWSRLTSRFQHTASAQWQHVLGELEESGEAMSIIRRAMTPGFTVSPEERDKVRAQLFDLFKVVPATLLVMTNAVLPLPGTSMVTPWLLIRLGFMPSRWREAYVLEKLKLETRRLRAAGFDEEAEALSAIRDDLETEVADRERIAIDAATLTFWDANQNGVWDDDERADYDQALQELARRWQKHATRKRWFLLHEGTVLGPLRISEVDPTDLSEEVLVCWDGKSGWIALAHLMATVNAS